MSEKRSTGVKTVSSLALEMRQSIVTLAGPRGLFDTRQRWLERGARAAKISYRTAKALFYCECENPHVSVVERVRSALQARQQHQEVQARAEYAELVGRIARLEQLLVRVDPDFHSAQMDAYREAATQMGGVDRTVD